jgi:hypothetical protein
MQDHTRSAARAIVLTACVFSLAAFSRPPSKNAPRPFELAVREIRVESGAAGDPRGPAPAEARSDLRHFGRIEPRGGKDDRSSSAATIYTDSLLFRSEAPFPFAAALDRDTIRVSSADDKPAAQMGGIDSDEEMLGCLFEGPSLEIRISEESPEAREIDHLKADCPGGLYRRLNLPVTMGPFVFAVPRAGDRGEESREWIAECPSFSGLGFFPQIRWRYAVKKSAPGSDGHAIDGYTIEISCDTTLAGLRATTPSGERIDIIADRIRVRGTLRPWAGLAYFHEGKIEIREEIRYVRSALDSGVLEKTCDATITLSPR